MAGMDRANRIGFPQTGQMGDLMRDRSTIVTMPWLWD
jgi:hypothetical protein